MADTRGWNDTTVGTVSYCDKPNFWLSRLGTAGSSQKKKQLPFWLGVSQLVMCFLLLKPVKLLNLQFSNLIVPVLACPPNDLLHCKVFFYSIRFFVQYLFAHVVERGEVTNSRDQGCFCINNAVWIIFTTLLTLNSKWNQPVYSYRAAELRSYRFLWTPGYIEGESVI